MCYPLIRRWRGWGFSKVERGCEGTAASVFLFWRRFWVGEGGRKRRVIVAEDRARGGKAWQTPFATCVLCYNCGLWGVVSLDATEDSAEWPGHGDAIILIFQTNTHRWSELAEWSSWLYSDLTLTYCLIAMADVTDQAIAEGALFSRACATLAVTTLSINSVQRCPRWQDSDQLAFSRLRDRAVG